MKRFTITIRRAGKESVFVGLANATAKLEERQISEAVYAKHHEKGLLIGQHYEVEILQPGLEDLRETEVSFFSSYAAGRPFMPTKAALNSMNDAYEAFEWWAIEAYLKKEYPSQDLAKILERDCDNDRSRLRSVLYRRFQIMVEGQISA